MNTISVNGKTYQVEGNNIQVSNGKITVDGVVIEAGLSGNVHVIWTGPLANLNCTSCTINGDVQGSVDGTSIKCGSVRGNVDGTSIQCGNVGGDVDGTNVQHR